MYHKFSTYSVDSPEGYIKYLHNIKKYMTYSINYNIMKNENRVSNKCPYECVKNQKFKNICKLTKQEYY